MAENSQNPSETDYIPSISTIRKRCIFLAGFVEMLMLGGTVLGWAQLVYLLKSDGVYFDLCFNSTAPTAFVEANNSITLQQDQIFKGCDAQDKQFALIFTMAILSYNCPNILMGYFLHHYGLAAARISAGIMNVAGYFCLGLTSKDDPWWLFPGVILIALGNTQLRISSHGLAKLLPTMKAAALTLISGAYTFSTSLFLIIQIFVDAGVKRRYAFWFMSGLSIVSIPLTFLMPKELLNEHSNRSIKKEVPLKTSILSLSFVTTQIWFCLSGFACAFLLTYFNSWISDIASNAEEASFYSKVLSFSAFVYPFISWLPGVITDLFSRRKSLIGKTQVDIQIHEIQNHFCVTFIVTLISVALIGVFFFKEVWAVYASVVLISLLRASMNGIAFYFVKLRFPSEHFNRIIGICGTSLCFGSVLLYGYFLWLKRQPVIGLSVMILMQLVSLVHPLHFLFTNHLKKSLQKTT